MASPATSMDWRIVRWQQSLLDLSLRNRLLNFKPERAVRLVRPDPAATFMRLVDEGQTLTIREVDDELADRTRPGEHEVVVASGPTGASPILRRMRLKAREAVNEQGVNILYAAFGMVRWYETENASAELVAPLVMVPVELLRDGPRDAFKIRAIEEDVVANPTLALRLASEFKITLPEWPEEKGKLPAYLQDAARAIAPMQRWGVEDAAFLGLFSFAKLSMYNELGSSAKLISKHPILNALAGDPKLLPPVPAYPAGEQLDTQTDPEETFQVLDADSSQQEAVEMAKRGISFVLQGPPGTGKSQTIANIVAESLAQGKKVLFVSEKMAALEVVKRRLDDRGLGDYILEMHSHKASKAAVVEELRRCMQPLPPSKPQVDDLGRLVKARGKLDAYVDAMHKERQPLGRSVYQAYGRLAALSGIPELPLPVPRASSMKLADLDDDMRTVRRVDLQRSIIGRSDANPWNDLRLDGWKAGDEAMVESSLRQLRAAMALSREASSALSTLAGTDRPRSMVESDKLADMLYRAASTPYPMEPWLAPGRPDALIAQMEEVRSFYLALASDAVWLNKTYTDEMRSQDTATLLHRFENEHHGFFRFLKGTYKSDIGVLQCLVRDGRRLKYSDALADLRRIEGWRKKLKEREALESGAAQSFGLRFKGEGTDWSELRSSLVWTSSFVRDYGDMLTPLVRSILCQPQGGATRLQEPVRTAHEALKRMQLDLDTARNWFRFADVVSAPQAVPYDQYDEFISRHLDALPLLKERVEVAALEKACADRGLGELFQLAKKGSLPDVDLTGAYEKRFYRTWLDQVTAQDEHLRDWHSDEHQETIRLFRKLDREQMDAAQRKLHARLEAFRSLSVDAPEAKGTELYALKHELNKKKKFKQIRQLFTECPNIIMELKPCLLMSPLSVSRYLEPGVVRFDVVIFDEASQVRPEDAVGSIMRGSQLIVVGDSRQLPPTAFFRSGPDEEDDETLEDLESILDECSAIGIKQHMLRWHYRSRDESLIAFSNRHVYGNQLYTFPSSARGEGEWGVDLVHVPGGVYDRGGSKTNVNEAKRVAELVMEHFTNTPERSLGVIAFSEPQQMAVLDQVEKLREKRPELEKHFAEGASDEFFVKNLENVQGDERDVIIFSVGYGRDAKGRMAQNFGPLNGPGGERRLNVAVTRARMHVKLVSSIKAADIETASSRGALLLKEYLAYAAGEGRADANGKRAEAEEWSPLEEEMYKALVAEGFKVRKRVGCSGYRIDLAIEDPGSPGSFILGIECDGSAYRSGTTARDRDRLRAEVLAGLGWKLHRVWSRDWVNDPNKEMEKIRAAVQNDGQSARNALRDV